MSIEYINYFIIKELKFQNTYTTGSLQSYSRPCIGYLTRGSGMFFCNGKTYYAKEGDLIYIAKDTKYYSVWYGEPDISFYSISFDFTHTYAFYGYRFQIVKGVEPQLLKKMLDHFENEPMLALSGMYELLNTLYPKMILSESHVQSDGIERAVTHIEENYTQPLSIDELCKACHCSRSSLFEQFRRRTGVSPIAYKHNVMIQHALDLLAHTDMTVEEISQKTGFSSSNYFRTVFIKMIGKTPKEVRRMEI